jgi:hypothetical protein
VVNIAVQQLVISSAGESSQYAFYAADSGMECALYSDLKNGSTSSFATSTPGVVTCNGQTITTGSQTVPTIPTQPSLVGGGGSVSPTSIFWLDFTLSTTTLGKGCAIVRVTKSLSGTTVDSRGYNTCDTGSSRRFERGVTISY